MDKKIVVVTLLLTALFVVGGVVLETHGGGAIIGDFYMMEGDWTLSGSASAVASGACASASPGISSNVSRKQEQDLDISGSATATAHRDGYWAVYGGMLPWWHGEDSPSDSGDIYARLKVKWTEHKKEEKPNSYKITATIGGTVKVINISGNFEFSPSSITNTYTWHDWYTVLDETKGRSATVGGNEYVNKSSGACGSFQGWSFDTGTRRYTAEN